jgi:iron complex outermembrane recepter protein
MKLRYAALAAAVASSLATGAMAAATSDVTGLSLEELMDLRVTSVAKRDQRLSDAAAAVFVITAEDIRRSGVTTLPEALRMAPGLFVGRINGGQWAVSARGFASRFARNLLVLVDGRSVYTPLFSGVFWDEQDIMLENVERIEVIRGPGASMWGANALNGVINIITRSSTDTQGGLVSASVGDVDRGNVQARYGTTLGNGATGRAWFSGGERRSSPDVGDTGGQDDWRRVRGGFRIDQDLAGGKALFQGEAYRSSTRDTTILGSLRPPYVESFDMPFVNKGAYLQGGWERDLGASGQLGVHAYLDHTDRTYLTGRDRRTTLDVELQHRLHVAERHELTYGLGYRVYADDFPGVAQVSVDPIERRYQLFSAFAQDEISLLDDKLHLTFGSRFEHNSFTGFEVQPNARVTFMPDPSHTFWGAVSRAVRTPSIIERQARAGVAVLPPNSGLNPSPLPVYTVVVGSGDVAAEVLYAYEIGWRAQVSASVAADVALYSNHYRGVIQQTVGTPELRFDGVPYIYQPLALTNSHKLAVNGAEAALDWRAMQGWRLKGTYTFTNHPDGPRNQAALRSTSELPGNLELDLWARYVDAVSVREIAIPSYVTFDVRLGWHPRRDLELSLIGQNLAQAQHAEFRSDTLRTLPMDVPRGVYAKVRWTF